LRCLMSSLPSDWRLCRECLSWFRMSRSSIISCCERQRWSLSAGGYWLIPFQSGSLCLPKSANLSLAFLPMTSELYIWLIRDCVILFSGNKFAN
jgi:hypothetical protein